MVQALCYHISSTIALLIYFVCANFVQTEVKEILKCS